MRVEQDVAAGPVVLSRARIVVLAIAAGVIVANLYYTQPLVAIISHALGLAPGAAGLVMTLTQVGYGVGILVAVPLGDRVENKRLMLAMIAIAMLGLVGLTFARQTAPYFAAAFATGLGCSTVQIIVPYAASFVPEARRGQTVGQLMSGLMLGIMLSRPISSFLTDLISWHAVFVLSLGFMAVLGVVLARMLPARRPAQSELGFLALFGSMGRLFAGTPVLQRRALYQAMMFGGFCLFWTAVPLLLAGPRFGMSQTQIAVFALVGVAGAISAPLAGIAADRGRAWVTSLLALLGGAAAFALGHVAPAAGPVAIPLLAVMAILLDAGVSASLVIGQRAIFGLAPQLRGRLNALYIASTFAGGATGSALGAWAFARGGWDLTTWVGLGLPMIALLVFFTEPRPAARPASLTAPLPAE
ncbi:MAG TPA: MFS transporter [Kofleriaceae bacterium]|jgi:predicted MFS family arabinose efflux permease|nr:MFS transporter [Kofleriaceae bacterium]